MSTGRTLPLLALYLTLTLLGGCEPEAPTPSRYPLIPLPADVDGEKGEFVLSDSTRILVAEVTDPEARSAVERWAEAIRRESGRPLPLTEEADGPDGDRIVIRTRSGSRGRRSPGVRAGEGLPGTEAESYRLRVTPRRVTLEAGGAPGIFYGLQTLRQLVPGLRDGTPGDSSSWRIPAVEIEDTPRFAYRGMHLDVGRHFFPVSFVKRYLDLLAAYKMNVFHWHLTEDQGWRLEIRAFPRLTEVGSCRAETILEKNFDPYVGDGTPYCGSYTQQEAREVVEYARERFITVIPEIEMPGHSVAALAAYPELACTPGPFEVATRWGVTEDIYCPKEETFAFLEEVLMEVMEIFPSPYVHIGGDEAPKARWEESEVAQEVIRREGLADEDELQSWFIRRIEEFLNAHGRRLIGWDEILEGGLAPNATVMSWRGMAGGVEAARQGHDVIMTPTSHVYFDYYQGDSLQEPLAIGGFTPLERVYAFEPVPAELSREEAKHVLGAQANVWTEYIATPEHVEYMAVPRMLALAEVIWTPPRERDWDSFLARLPAHLRWLEQEGVNYRIPDVRGLEGDRLTLQDSVRIDLFAPVADAEIRYTLDGSEPSATSPLYEGPFWLPVDEGGRVVAARLALPSGRMGAVRRARFARTRLAGALPLPRGSRAPGLTVKAYRGSFATVDSLEAGEPLPAGEARGELGTVVPRVQVPPRSPRQGFGLVLEGFIRVPRNGIYTFHLASDDGSRLALAGRVVVDHDGLHALSERAGQVALQRGWHPISVRYFQAGGGRGLRLEIEGPGVSRREVPAHWLAHPAANGKEERPGPAEAAARAEIRRPYRSVASGYLGRLVESA